MDSSFNKDPNIKEDVKTSSTDSVANSKTTGDSQEQNGIGVGNHTEKSYEKSEEAEEYIDDANQNTAVANDDPVQDGKGMTN